MRWDLLEYQVQKMGSIFLHLLMPDHEKFFLPLPCSNSVSKLEINILDWFRCGAGPNRQLDFGKCPGATSENGRGRQNLSLRTWSTFVRNKFWFSSEKTPFQTGLVCSSGPKWEKGSSEPDFAREAETSRFCGERFAKVKQSHVIVLKRISTFSQTSCFVSAVITIFLI